MQRRKIGALVRRWQVLNVRLERRGHRDHQRSSRLLRDKPDLPALTAHVRPRHPRHVAETLAGVESEKDHRAPFVIRDREHGADFIKRKGAALLALALRL